MHESLLRFSVDIVIDFLSPGTHQTEHHIILLLAFRITKYSNFSQGSVAIEYDHVFKCDVFIIIFVAFCWRFYARKLLINELAKSPAVAKVSIQTMDHQNHKAQTNPFI